MRRLGVALVLLAAGCSVDPPRDNPADPKSPNVAKGAVSGIAALDPTSVALGDVAVTEVTVLVDGSPEVNADSTGAFKVEGVSNGPHTVELRAPYHEPRRLEAVEVLPGKVAELGTLVLARGRGQLSGRVQVAGREAPDGGCPAGAESCGDHSGTQVSIANHLASEPRFTVTNLAGEYQLTDVAAGKRILAIRREGYDPAQVAEELQPGERRQVPDYTIGAGFSAKASGHVVLEGIDPPSSEYSQVVVSLRGGVASTQSDDLGAFTLSSPLGGTFSIVLTRAGYERRELPGIGLRHNATVDLDALLGGPVYLRKARGGIRGQVAVTGSSNDGVEVCAQGTAYCALSAVPAGKSLGEFRIDDVPSGLVLSLSASKRDGINAFTGNTGPRTIAVGPATDFGAITLSALAGDFQLHGRSIDPASGALQSSTRYTVEEWVRVEPAGLTQPGYGFIATSLDGGFSNWQPLPPTAPDCTLAVNQGSPLCVQLPAEGVNSLSLVLGNGADGGTQRLGPFRGSITWDKTPPANPAVKINGGAAWLNAAGAQDLALSVSAVDSSPLLSMRVAAVSEPADELSALTAAPVVAFSAAPSVPVPDYALENQKKVAVRIYDAAGNSAQASASIRLDKTAPFPVGLQVVKNDAGFVSQSLVSLTASVDAGIADVASVRLSNDSIGVPFVEVPLGAGATSLTTSWLLPGGDGTYSVYAKFTDLAGNVSEPPAQATVTVDSTPPSSPLVVLAENPCAGGTDTIANGWTKHSSVCVTVPVDPDIGFLLVQGCSTPIFAGAASDCALLPAGDGPKTIVLRAVDRAGNVSAPATRAVILDTVAPAAPVGFSIVSSAPPAKFVNSQVVVHSTVLAPNHDVFQMRLEQTVPAAQTGQWVAFAQFGVHLLATAAQGTHTLGVRVRDFAENQSATLASDSVVLDSVSPGAPDVAMPSRNASGWVQAETGLLLNVLSTEAAIDTNFAAVEVIGALSCSPACTQASTPASFTLAVKAGVQTFLRVRARDLAGNLGAESLLPVAHDGIDPPAPLILSPAAPDPCVTPGEPFTSLSTQVMVLSTPTVDANFDGFDVVSSAAACTAATTGWARTQATSPILALQPGLNSLCVRAADKAGRTSPIVQVRVIQDSAAPTTPTVGSDQTLNADAAPIILRTQSIDSSPFVYEVIGGAYGNWTPIVPGCVLRRPLASPYPGPPACPAVAPSCASDGRDFYEASLVEDTDNFLFVRAVDAAGNVGAPSALLRITERSSYPLSGSVAGANYARPHLESDRVVWTGNQGVQLFDLTRRDPGAGDVGIRIDGSGPLLPAGAYSRATTFGNTVAWSENNDIKYCHLDSATGACVLPVIAPAAAGTADLERYPIATGDRILYHRLGATEGIYSLAVATNTVSPLALGAVSSFLSGRRVFDSGAFPANASQARVAWISTTGNINTQRTDAAAPTQISSAPSAVSIWNDGRTVVWDTGSIGLKSVLGCVEPFSGTCAPATLLGPGPHADIRGLSAFPEATRTLVGSISDAVITGRPMLASAPSGATRRYPINGQATSSSSQAGKFVFHRANGSRDESIDLWDATTLFSLDSSIAAAIAPAVSGQRYAWLDPRFGAAIDQFDVFTADFGTGRIRRETAGPAVRSQLAFDYPWLVWVEAPGGVCPTSCVRFKNVATGATGRVGLSSCNLSAGCWPRVSGQRVVWTDYRAANLDIYLVDLTTSIESAVATTAAAEQHAWISGDRIVWLEAPDRIQTRNLGPASAGCPASECVAGPSGCRFNRPASTRGFPSVWSQPLAPCAGSVAWEEENGLATARIGVFDWARAAGRILDEDLRPTPPATPPLGPQRRPVATAEWVAFEQSRLPFPGGASNLIRLYWWRADAVATIGVGTRKRYSPASDGSSVAFLEDVGTVRIFRPARLP